MKYVLSQDIKHAGAAAFIRRGLFFGGLINAGLARNTSGPLPKQVFGIFLLFISLQMIFTK